MLTPIDFTNPNILSRIIQEVRPTQLVISNNGWTYFLDDLEHCSDPNPAYLPIPTFPTSQNTCLSLAELQALSKDDKNKLLRFDLDLATAIENRKLMRCRLSLESMLIPLSTPSGYSYETHALIRFLKNILSKTDIATPSNNIRWHDPMKNDLNFTLDDLIPNHSLKSMTQYHFQLSINNAKKETCIKNNMQTISATSLPPKKKLSLLLAERDKRHAIPTLTPPPEATSIFILSDVREKISHSEIDNIYKTLQKEYDQAFNHANDHLEVLSRENASRIRSRSRDIVWGVIVCLGLVTAIFFSGKKAYESFAQDKNTAATIGFTFIVLFLALITTRVLCDVYQEVKSAWRYRVASKMEFNDHLTQYTDQLEAQLNTQHKIALTRRALFIELNKIESEGFQQAMQLLSDMQPRQATHLSAVCVQQSHQGKSIESDETLPLLSTCSVR